MVGKEEGKQNKRNSRGKAKYCSIKRSNSRFGVWGRNFSESRIKREKRAIETKGNKIKIIGSPISNKKECRGEKEKTRQEMCEENNYIFRYIAFIFLE